MDVNITDYGQGEFNFVEYAVQGLSLAQINYLNETLEEQTSVEGDILLIRMYFDDELYPFQSDVAKFRLEDFISREEIEMNVFISSVLQDLE